MKKRISQIIFYDARIDLRQELVRTSFSDESIKVLDCGASLREYRSQLNPEVEYLTLDFLQELKPDFLVDICDTESMSKIPQKFDLISCFSILEHVHNPLAASQNLFDCLAPSGKIFGYVPFLFPRHCPDDLSYQDFWRFTKESLAILFPRASQIEVWPERGRLATALLILTMSYKFVFEKRFPKFAESLSSKLRTGKHLHQTSGYNFIISR